MSDVRLIDANALTEYFKRLARSLANARCFSAADAVRGAAEKVSSAPTIDAVPVVHGRWVEHPQYDVFGDCCYIDYECSLCHSIACEDAEHYSYCPNCGQPMDAKGTDVRTKDEEE